MAPQYLKNNHVTYYVITQVRVYAAQQWSTYYVRREVDTVSESQIKLPEAGVQTSYVHSSGVTN